MDPALIKARLIHLQREHAAGQQQLAALAAQTTATHDTVQRITGAVLFAEELLAAHEAEEAQKPAKETPVRPAWAAKVSECVDADPAIRCHPAADCVFEGPEGLVLTIMPRDGGDVSSVNLADVLVWAHEREQAKASAARTVAGMAPEQVPDERPTDAAVYYAGLPGLRDGVR